MPGWIFQSPRNTRNELRGLVLPLQEYLPDLLCVQYLFDLPSRLTTIRYNLRLVYSRLRYMHFYFRHLHQLHAWVLPANRWYLRSMCY